MESRRVYRGIEEAASTGRFGGEDHRHSWLSRSLRYTVRELSDMRSVVSAQLLAVSSLYGNSKTKIESGNDFVKEKSSELMSTIPYIASGAASHEQAVESIAEEYVRFMREYDRLIGERSEGRSGDGRKDGSE